MNIGKRLVIIATLSVAVATLSWTQEIEKAGDNQIRLGSFNIEKLGKRVPEQVENAAELLKNYDIVAIQGIMNSGATLSTRRGKRGIEALESIVEMLGEEWTSVVSKEPNGTAREEHLGQLHTFEYYAFIYRSNKIELILNSARLWDEQKNKMPNLEDQERQFDREPFIASFKTTSGNLDFTLITFHAASPTARWRTNEIARLAKVYNKIQDFDKKQNDVFLLGTFNTPASDASWLGIRNLKVVPIFEKSDVKTTFNKLNTALENQYDNIWYQADASKDDIVENSGMVDEAWTKAPENLSDENNKKSFYIKNVSDHLPITMLLRTDKDTDHFGEAPVDIGEDVEAPEGSLYVIKEGDTLRSIAREQMGGERKFHALYKANQEVIKNPNNLPPGELLIIPKEE
jgi:hypothetical protein